VLEAREALLVCQQESCPVVVRKDCTSELEQVEAAIPSVVVVVRDAHGDDVTDVALTIDGKQVATSLDGRAIKLDPGVRAFHVEMARGGPAIDQKVVVHLAEKNRVIVLTAGDGGGSGGAGGAEGGGGGGDEGRDRDKGRSGGGHGVAPWIVVGVGGALMVAGGIVWGLAQADVDAGQKLCPSGVCTSTSDKRKSDDLQQGGQTRTYIGVGLLGAGAVAVAGGLVWHFVFERGAAGRAFAPEVGPRYGGVAYTARFF